VEIDMDPTSKDLVVVLVSETDQMHDMVRASIEQLGERVRGVRAVNAEARRFADEIAANPSVLQVEVHDVVGYAHPDKDRPNLYEPLILEKGKPTPVSLTNMDAVEWWVATRAELTKNRQKIIATCARKLAEEMIISEALFFAIDQADRDTVLTSMSCDARKRSVDFYPDHDGKIAKRLPKWIKVDEPPPPKTS
jgi:hypothetical protein